MPRFLRRCSAGVLTVAALTSFLIARAETPPVNPAPGAAFRDNAQWTAADGALTTQIVSDKAPLISRATLADSVTAFEYRAPVGSRATVYVQGRYIFEHVGNGQWQPFNLRFRAPRFDAGYNKLENAFILDVKNGSDFRRSVILPGPNDGAIWGGEDRSGPMFIIVRQAPFSVRNASHRPADFAQVTLPKESGGETNEKQLQDLVALGKELFTQVGCEACHQVVKDSTAVSTGPNLFGLFRSDARTREVVEGGEGHRFQVKANREYLHRSLREPAAQLAVAEAGESKGVPYAALMPVFTNEIVSDEQIDAIGAYLATLNDVGQRGPVTWLGKLKPTPPYDPMADGLQWLVNDTVRMQRGPLPGTSARAIHVGFPGGINYSFDPRLLAIVKIWQGGFLDMSGELTNRGGKGLALGYESREIGFGEREYLLAPLDAQGKLIDFTFKDAKFGDMAAIRESLYSPQDQLDRIAAIDAQFL